MLKSLVGYAVVCVCLAVNAPKSGEDNKVVRFDEVDEDGDGKVTYNEFEHWHKKNEANLSDQKLKSLFQSNDKNGDTTLSIAEFVQVALELSRNPVRQTEQIFQEIDSNGDGAITREEAEQSGNPIIMKIMEGVFQMADTDHNGQITLKEFAVVVENDKPKTQAEKDKESANRLLALMDQNADRKLDVKEVHAFANINSKVSEQKVRDTFGDLDADRDGYVSLDELINVSKKMAELVHFKEAPPVSLN
uniref:Calmodulin n=1 Tax=Ascaris lumbricoides TaxID=6252 RepID=A0A0M3I843_ASCLU